MDEKADNGNIISQKSVKIEYEDDAASLYVKLTRTALAQLDEFVPLLKKDAVPQIKQDASKANYWRKRNKFDGKIDFRMNSKAIYNLVRGLTRPYPGAHAVYKDTEIKIWKVKEVFSTFENNIEPGKILDILPSGNILVKACDNAIEIIEHSSTTFPLKGEYFV
ncbi:MAG: hypothetical protein ACD_79C00758G0001 [uncultured bacterium]|nr:MAG: hypothetical protein ACD_79C00758G0001 [uncultured bacterium]